MSEIREQTILDIVNILEEVKGISATEAYEKLITHPNIAIVDREAKVPQRPKLPKGYLLLEAEDKNDIYLNGQIFAQEEMLKESWVKELNND